jgi:hypothetical protein
MRVRESGMPEEAYWETLFDVLVIYWRWDRATPRGPSLEIRPRPEQIVAWAEQTKLLDAEGPVIDLPPWHYGLRLRREGFGAGGLGGEVV